jgi:chemotaxis protein MotA
MAVALLTTFYGALLANMFFLPMVTKLDRRIKIEDQQIELMIVGMMSINHNDSLAIMREKMKAYLAEQPDNFEELLSGR